MKTWKTRHPRDSLKDLKVSASEFDDNLDPKNYFDWVQAFERIFGLKEDNDGKAFKLAILKLKGYASLWYEQLKKSRAKEAKSEIKTWSKLKKHIDKGFLPHSYKQELYLKTICNAPKLTMPD